jgi:DNA sulfur modification protein DndD
MAEVFIDSLTLENFGPFYGSHTLNFGSLEGKCGILIGGKNGAGKTHLLRALYLAVVGESGVGDLKRVEPGSESTRFNFEKSLNRKAQAEGQDTTKLEITISQRDHNGGGSRKVTLTREIRHRQNSPPLWKSYAKKSDGDGIIDDEQVIQRLRDAFLPRHLARFFFFDAERSQSINLGQQDIIEGVSRILGLWTYGELENDLRQLIQNKIPRIYNSSSSSDAETRLIELNTDVSKVEGYIGAKNKELARIELEVHELDVELLEVEDELKALGAVNPEDLQRSHERKTEITQTKAKLEEQLTTAWEYALPVSMLGRYRKELHDYLVKEEKRRDWEGARSSVEPKIPQVKADVFGDVPAEYSLQPETESFFSTRLDKALQRLFNPPPEGMADTVFAADRNDLSAQVRARLASGSQGLRGLAELCQSVERMDSELRQVDQKLRELQQNSAAIVRGGQLHSKRGELAAKREQLLHRKSELTAEVAKYETDLKDLKRLETNQRETVEKMEKGQNLAALAAKYREAVADIRGRAAIQLRKKISENVGELWINITDRGREFVGLEFDTHWNCFLIRKNGKKVSWEETNTSAGQRQVRMLAFYEALRRLAKSIPPLVVDTPLGRLDKEVKDKVLDELYLSGHQSLILSTNSEVDPDSKLFSDIRDRLARVYTLHAYGKPDSIDYEVRVSTDYFGQDL